MKARAATAWLTIVANAAPATPIPNVKMNSGSRAMLSSVAAPWIMTGVFTLPLAREDRAEEDRQHHEGIAAGEYPEVAPGLGHEFGGDPEPVEQWYAEAERRARGQRGDQGADQNGVLGRAVGAHPVARADRLRDDRGDAGAEAEGHAHRQEHERHVEGEGRQRLRTHPADEEHVDDHVERLDRHADQDRHRQQPQRTPRIGDETVQPIGPGSLLHRRRLSRGGEPAEVAHGLKCCCIVPA